MSTCMVRQYVTTIMTSGMKKATKEPISMKRSSLRTQLPLTKTLSSLWRPMTGIGIDTPGEKEKNQRLALFFLLFLLRTSSFVVFNQLSASVGGEPRSECRASSVYSKQTDVDAKHNTSSVPRGFLWEHLTQQVGKKTR